jgi:hypothetical protein
LHVVEGPGSAPSLIRLERETSEPFQEIKSGQILTGKIVSRDPQGYIVNFRGKSFLLRTTESFEEGQEVRAEFVEQNGEYHLRPIIAGPKAPSAAPGADSSVDQRVTALLARLGLEANPENAAAARQLILAGLPVSRGLLESLALLLSGKTSFETELVQLTQLIRNLLPRVGDLSLSDPLKEIIAILEDAIKAPAESDLAARVRSFLADSGIFAESKIRTLLESGAAAEARQSIATDLKFALLRLRSLVAARSQDLRQAGGAGTLKELELYVTNALRFVRGQQVQNLLLAGMNQLLFHIPFLRDWGLENVRIRFFHDPETSKSKDPRPLAILVEVSTSNLGPLRAVLRLYRERIYCHFTAEREAVAKLIRAESPDLREHLETLRFTVGGITCGVGKCDHPTNVPFLQTVDVKV